MSQLPSHETTLLALTEEAEEFVKNCSECHGDGWAGGGGDPYSACGDCLEERKLAEGLRALFEKLRKVRAERDIAIGLALKACALAETPDWTIGPHISKIKSKVEALSAAAE